MSEPENAFPPKAKVVFKSWHHPGTTLPQLDIEARGVWLQKMFRTSGHTPISKWDQWRLLREWFIDLPTAWTVFDMPIQRCWSGIWQDCHGEWLHSAGRTGEHNRLGEAFAHFFERDGHGVQLRDSPDLQGALFGEYRQLSNGVRAPTFYGDIGQATFNAVFWTLPGLGAANTQWISVLDWDTHVVVEFLYSHSELARLKFPDTC